MATCENDNELSSKPVSQQINLGETEKMSIEDESHPCSLMKGLHCNFKKQRFCDVTLVFDKKEIKAHKVILASVSQYFEAMFSTNFIDCEQQRLEIVGIDENVGEALLEFAYSGKILINAENVLDILAGANFLQGFEAVEKHCSKYLQKYAGKKNAFQILQIADRFHQNDLKQAMLIFSWREFVDCVEQDHEGFLSLPEYLLIELISAEELVVYKDGKVYLGPEQEEYLLKIVIEYMEHKQKQSHKIHAEEILKCIRLPLLKKKFLQELKSNKLFASNKKCLSVIEDARKAQKTKKKKDETTPQDKWMKKRACGEYQLWKGRCLAAGGYVNNVVNHFDDSNTINVEEDYVTGMELWIRRWDGRPVIGGMKIHYKSGKFTMHGSDKAEEKEKFTLEPNERIVKMDSQSGWMIDNLTFYTNKERKLGPFGGSGGGFRHEAPPNWHGYLVHVKGAVVDSQDDLGINKLQFVWRLFRMKSEDPAADYYEEVVNNDSYSDEYDDYDDYDHYDDYDDYDGYDEYDDYNVDYDDFYAFDPADYHYQWDPIADEGGEEDGVGIPIAEIAAAIGSNDNTSGSNNLDKEVD